MMLCRDLPRGELIVGRGKAKTHTVTIRDVARDSGFSSTTVSIVLNDAPLARFIPDGTKARIQKVAKQLGYRPNLFARSLRSNRSHTIRSAPSFCAGCRTRSTRLRTCPY
jgi:hypothetical protein